MGNIVSTPNEKISYGINNTVNPRAGYYSNKNSIIYKANEIILLPDENIKEFVKLKYSYAKTNKRVFYKGRPIDNANPELFSVINRDSVKLLKNMDSRIDTTPLIKLNSILGIEYSYPNKTKIYYKGKLVNNN